MARFTIKQFAKSLGLKDDREGITHASITLKTLHQRGLAPVVDKVKPHVGRPALVYDLDQNVAESLGIKAEARRTKVTEGLDVWEVLALVNKIRESKGLEYMFYDDFVTKLRGLRDGYEGKNNPYRAAAMKGSTRVFSKRSAFLIGRKIAAMKARRGILNTYLRAAV